MTFNFGELADEINEKQERVDLVEAKAAAQTKDLKLEIKDLEQRLLLAMQGAGLTTIKGAKSIADVKVSLRVSIKDFEALEKFVIRRKAIHLFERRISTVAYKELKESLGGKDIPGLGEFNQEKLNVRRAK